MMTSATTLFTLENKCTYTVWPGIISGNSAISGDGGFSLAPDNTHQIIAQPGWSGRIWARTGCNFDDNENGHCTTGDCGSRLRCLASGAPPATLVEFTIGSGGGMDFYDVSLVDGYNVGISVRAQGGLGDCRSSGCAADINAICPWELKVVGDDGGKVVACKSACVAFGSPEFCCSGQHSNPDTCNPTSYSRMFKNACPQAYSYAYDDKSSLGTCTGSNYVITFCPSELD
ncbi:hypothetical protein CASFOL_021290 [Castilleja foliolosa]|uniref:Thaumatin-like protein n=1 Tax=Castilleja foliolosa TaxID=1961234 RepID=A0ABD3CW61_9LAMI